MSHKNAIVTGSTSGIGKAIARSLAQEGYNIVLNGFIDQNTVQSLLLDFQKQYNVKAIYSDANMQHPDQIRAMVQKCIEYFGSIDVLVNNAGIQFVSNIELLPEDKWDQVIEINLSAAFHTIKAALPNMQQNNFGRIINIASAHGIVASGKKSAYVASKHGIVGLTKVVAIESADYDITCNAICPGWVNTELVEKQILDISKSSGISEEQARQDLLGAKQPQKRFVNPEDIGALVVFVAGKHGSSMTGEIISIDGGWTAH